MSKQVQAKANSFIRVPVPVPLNGAVTWNFHTEGQIGSRAGGDRYIYCADAASSSNYTNSSGGVRRNQPCLYVNGNRYNAIICSSKSSSSSIYWSATNCYAYADLKQKVDFGYDGSSYYLRTERYRDGTQKPLFEYNQNFGTQESCTSSNRYGGNNTPFAQGVSTSYAYFYNGGTTTYYNPTAIVVSQFEFTNYWSNTFTNPSSSSTVVPTSVKIDASNDNSTWTTLTTITSIPKTNNGKYYYNNPDTETAYHYYRFTFNATTGRPAVTSIRLHSDFFPVGWEADYSQTLVTSADHTISSARVMLFNSYADIANCYLTQPMNLSETRITYTDSQEVEHTVFDGNNLINGNYVTTGVTLEDGIASGFNSQKFIVLPTPLGTTYANTTSLLTRFQYVRNSSNNYDYEQVLFYQQDTNARLTFLSSDLVALRIGSDVMVGRTKLTEGNWYFLYYVKDGNDHKVFILEDNGEYIFNLLPRLPLVETDANNNLVHSTSPWHYEFRMWYNAPIFSNYVLLGSRYAGNSAFRGKIDLNFTMFGNDVIHYNLHKDEYLDNGGYKSITEDTTINVPMSAGVVFDVDCTTEDAIIELTARGYEQSGTSITVAPGTVVYYNIHKKGYKTQSGSRKMLESYTLHTTLEISYSELITMEHPFLEADYATQLTQLFSNGYFYRNPTLEAITNINTSGVHNITYISYFTFHTGDDPEFLTFSTRGYVSSENGGDYGGVYVTSNSTAPTRDWLYNGTTSGDGTWLFRQSGTGNSVGTYTKTLQADTDYYCYLCWGKNSSGSSGSDALIVKEISFPTGKALKTINYTSPYVAEFVDGTALPTSTQTLLSLFESSLLPEARLAGADAEKGYTFDGWYLNNYKALPNMKIPVGESELSANWLGDEVRFTLVPSEVDATVILTAPRAAQDGNHIDVHPGYTVNYTVKKRGFKTVRGSYTMSDEPYTLNITMEVQVEYWYTNFDADAYLTIPNATIGTADEWEMVWHVMTGQYNFYSYYICSGNTGNCMDIGIAGDQIWKMFLSSNGSGWNIVNGASNNIACRHNTKYWVKVAFTGSAYNMYVSTEEEPLDEDYTLVATHSSSTKLFATSSYRIGCTYDKYWAWPGFIDIGSSYIRVNHKVNDSDNWTYDFEGSSAEAGVNYTVVGSPLGIEGELPAMVLPNINASGTSYTNSYTNTESGPLIPFTWDTSIKGSYNRWQTYGIPAATEIHYNNHYMKAKYWSVGIWHEEESFNERVANSWNLYVVNDLDSGLDITQSNWKSKCTLVSSVTNQLAQKLYSYQAEQGKMKMFEIPEQYQNLVFDSFVLEVTNNRSGYSTYTDTYRVKLYGEQVADPRVPSTLTIVPSENDATVVLSCPGAVQSGNSITGHVGQNVTYRVSKEGFKTVTGTYTLTEVSPHTINVTMEEGTSYLNRYASGFGVGKYITLTPTINGSSSCTFITSFKPTDNYLRWIASPTDGSDNPIYINYNYALTVWYGNPYGEYPISSNVRYWLRVDWTNNLYLKYGIAVDDNATYTTDTLPALTDTSFWTIIYDNSGANAFAGNRFALGCNFVYQDDSYAFAGFIDLGKTMIIDNGVTVFDGQTAVEGVDFTNTGNVTITEQTWPDPD